MADSRNYFYRMATNSNVFNNTPDANSTVYNIHHHRNIHMSQSQQHITKFSNSKILSQKINSMKIGINLVKIRCMK